MEIICPQCQFARSVPDEKIPERVEIATCPKCKLKFRFRNLDGPADAVLSSAGVPAAPDTPADPEAPLSAQSSEDRPKAKAGPDQNGEEFWDKLASMGQPHQEARQEADPGPGHKQAIPPEVEIPWENLDRYGFFTGLWETIRRVMVQPTAFFRSMPVGGGQIKPLIFYLLIAQFQIVMQMLWGMVGMGVDPTAEAGMAGGMDSMILFLAYPFLWTIMVYVMALLAHGCLVLTRGAGCGFEGTFRALTYGSAPMIMVLVPMIGPLIGAVWSLVTTFLGYKNIHRTTSGKVILAMVLPMIPFILLLLMLIMSQDGGAPLF
jgi:hypothetical protein